MPEIDIDFRHFLFYRTARIYHKTCNHLAICHFSVYSRSGVKENLTYLKSIAAIQQMHLFRCHNGLQHTKQEMLPK